MTTETKTEIHNITATSAIKYFETVDTFGIGGVKFRMTKTASQPIENGIAGDIEHNPADATIGYTNYATDYWNGDRDETVSITKEEATDIIKFMQKFIAD